MKSRAICLLLVLCCPATVRAFRQPHSRKAPLGFFDVRTRLPERSTSGVRDEVRAGVAAFCSVTTATVQIRLHPATGRPRHLFTLEGWLTGPSAQSPIEIAKAFLSDHGHLFGLSVSEIAEAAVGDLYRHPDGKTQHLVLQQRCSGLDVFQARVQFAFDAQGRVIHVAGDYYPGLQVVGKVRLSPLEAVQWAAAHCDRARPRGGEVARDRTLRLAVVSPETGVNGEVVFARGPFRDPVAAHLVVMPLGGKGIPAWEMTLHISPTECYHVVVDARDGSLLYRANLYQFAVPSGLVFTEHPDAGPQQVVPFTGDAVASPLGWCHATTTTQGNNVVAREDADANNEDVLGIQPFSADCQFLYSFTNSWADYQTTAPDVNAAVTNLFYFVNWYHDYLYDLGFDEASGNFQLENFGRGGNGGDRVHADAMDGSGFNNSNFLTLVDGDPPGPSGHSRIQMFLFKPSPPLFPIYRDGALDGDVVLHEYTHGLTTRMVGGPSNVLALRALQSVAMAEGWSDFFPCSIFDDPVVAEYVTGNTERGVRHFAYDDHPWLFGAVGNTFAVTEPALPSGGPFATVFLPEEHNDGEIWAAALWALRDALGYARLAESLVVEALRYTPPSPTMLDGRDAILVADTVKFQGVHHGQIWRAFAQRGMGCSAEAEVGPKAALVFQAFDWPPAFGGSFSTGTVVFADDMEGDLSGWTVAYHSSGAGVAFHPTSHRSASLATSWYFGREQSWDYDTNFREWSTLESPPIALPSGAGCLLEFKHWRSAEDGVDWNNAPFYFDPGIVYVRVAGTDEFHQIGFAFHNTSAWETRRIDLSAFAGQTVRVGFYLDTWDSRANDYEGWYIDDVRVIQSSTVNTAPTATRNSWNSYR
ncbi:hypothetical protein AMJ85_01750 [candidate division BRC1 bacterium SM23_51]|nr:MAG: hypothetical protein AMJ85_01750 [candidate division BRC1 bacterium SM23_51]